MTESEYSNTDTQVASSSQDKPIVASSAPERVAQTLPEGVTILPPRTGYLRVSWYVKDSKFRSFPAACSAGLSVLAVTLFSLGLILCGAHDVTSPAVLLGSFFFVSGLVQIICGIWAIADNNLFGSTFLLSYAAFFVSLGFILFPGNDITAQYATTGDFYNAYGLFLLAWVILTFVLLLCTLKSTVPLVALMVCLLLFFILYTAYAFTLKAPIGKAAGVFAFIVSIAAFYGVWDGFSDPATFIIRSPEDAFGLRMPTALHEPSYDTLV